MIATRRLLVPALFAILFRILGLPSLLTAQSTSVETLGTITAQQAATGLGFNLDPDQDWQWALAAAAGATHARVQCPWSGVEQQTAPPENASGSPRYVQSPACVSGFASAAKYGIQPTVVAAYGPPYHPILAVSLPQGAAAGATSLNIELQSGFQGESLSKIRFPYDYICPAATSNGQLTSPAMCSSVFSGKHSYQGTLITGVKLVDATHATLTLASAVLTALPADTTPYLINEVLYPSTASADPTDPSIVAYTDYVSFLASDIAAHGLKGDIEIWNEPPWTNDPWDNRCALYDAALVPTSVCKTLSLSASIQGNQLTVTSLTGGSLAVGDQIVGANLPNSVYVTGIQQGSGGSGVYTLSVSASVRLENMAAYTSTGLQNAGFPNFGFVAALQTRSLPSGVTATWSGTSGSGASTVLGPRMVQATGSKFSQPNTAVTSESFHPYGNTPEQTVVPADCLQAAAQGTVSLNSCVLPGEPTGQNLINAVYADLQAKVQGGAYGIGHEVTETGMSPPASGLDAGQARFIMRHFLALQADGVTPVEFFKLCMSGDGPSYTFVQSANCGNSAYTPSMALTAIGRFMADIKPISNLPVKKYTAADLPSVSTYQGTYPLSLVHLVGARSGAKANSDAFVLWQRSFTACDASGKCPVWITQASPASGPVAVEIPSGMQVSAVVDLVTRSSVSYSVSGQKISFRVADNPIEILLDPSTDASLESSSTTLRLNASPASSGYGDTVQITASLTSSGQSVEGEAVNFYEGVTPLGSAALISGSAGISLHSFAAGQHTVMASFVGDAHHSASSASFTVSVSPASPGLAFVAIPTQTYGVSPFTLHATSASTGAITYSLVSGPATLSGNILNLQAIGTVTLHASQSATANYGVGSADISFSVIPKSTTFAFSTISDRTYGDPAFAVRAASASSGAVSYKVVSGPATLSGTLLTLTGAGTVTLQANQVAYQNYAAASAQTSFNVVKRTVPLTLNGIADKVYGAAPFQISATSSSPGGITYQVLSGPATVAGSLVTVTATGVVKVRATLAATANYNGATADTSFNVFAQTSKLAFASIGAQTYGVAPLHLSATSASPGPVVYTVTSGPAVVAGNVLTVTGAGTIHVHASQAAYGSYTAATTDTAFPVNPATPTLTIGSIANQTYGVSPFTVSAKSNSPGSIAYSITGGRATISGNRVTVTGIGTVQVRATQLATANFLSSIVTTSFSVAAQPITLVFNPIPNRVWGDTHNELTVNASSASAGPITYSVVSGPATISSNGVKITAAGTVRLHAVQPAWSGYGEGSADISFVVAPAPVALKFSAIQPQIYGAPAFAVRAQSVSSAPVTYTAVSGPGIVRGNLVSTTGTGTVVLLATQDSDGKYAAASTQISVVIDPDPVITNQ